MTNRNSKQHDGKVHVSPRFDPRPPILMFQGKCIYASKIIGVFWGMHLVGRGPCQEIIEVELSQA